MPQSEYNNTMNLDERVMMAIVRVAERFKKESTAIFKKFGLTFPQYNVLRVLESSKNGQNMVRDINRIMLVSGANMTGITKRMEKTGFIIRKNDPNDDRLKWLEITPKGKAVLKDIAEDNERNVKRYLKDCSAGIKTEMLSILNGILNLER